MKSKYICVLIIAVCMIPGMTGCKSINKRLLNQFHAESLTTEDSIKKLECKYSNLAEVQDNLEKKFTSIGSDEAARQRDLILNDLIRISDFHYNNFKHSAFISNSGWNTGLDLASIGLSAAATLVGGPTAQALSATDTGIKAAQGRINERWLTGQTVLVLISTMDAMRAETLAVLYNKMHTYSSNYERFGISEGIGLVAKYHQQASLLEAMNQMTAQADALKQKNQAKVTEMQMR
jgi:hypothetical protein